MTVMTLIESVRSTLAEEMRRDESIVVLGEDVGKKGGVFLATDGLYDEFGGDRVLDTPLSESMIVGVSMGAGRRPTPLSGASRRASTRCAAPSPGATVHGRC
jgi:pyruvate/2-oxoglutarate/acetoin dehydrogenase E1 component